jgi:hypothetical protein
VSVRALQLLVVGLLLGLACSTGCSSPQGVLVLAHSPDGVPYESALSREAALAVSERITSQGLFGRPLETYLLVGGSAIGREAACRLAQERGIALVCFTWMQALRVDEGEDQRPAQGGIAIYEPDEGQELTRWAEDSQAFAPSGQPFTPPQWEEARRFGDSALEAVDGLAGAIETYVQELEIE